MYCKFDLDQRSLVRALDDQTVKSYKLAFPDKYPIKIDFYRSGVGYSVSGRLKATLKPINQQGTVALALMDVAASGTTAEGVLDLATTATRDFVKNFGERPAALEILVTDQNSREIASWTINCEVSRRYTATDDIVVSLPDSKATQQEAEQGVSNERWMTPVRVWQALRKWAETSLTWTEISGKPSTFPPSAHQHTISDVTSLETVLAGKQPLGAYASLVNGLIPSSQLPSYVDDVVEAASFSALPATGESGKVYVSIDTNKVYRWGGSVYVEISPSPGSSDSVPEGARNLYFTEARVNAVLASFGIEVVN